MEISQARLNEEQNDFQLLQIKIKSSVGLEGSYEGDKKMFESIIDEKSEKSLNDVA